MGGVTDTQSIRFGYVTDPQEWTMVRNLADDVAAQLDLADAQAVAVLQSPVAVAQRNATLAVPVTTVTSIPFDSEQYDTHAMIDIAGQPNRLTVSSAAGAGLYTVEFFSQSDTTGWTRGDIIVNKNGSQYCRRNFRAPQPFGYMQLTLQIHLGTVGDFVTFQIYHEGGGTTNLLNCSASIFKISDN